MLTRIEETLFLVFAIEPLIILSYIARGYVRYYCTLYKVRTDFKARYFKVRERYINQF